MKQFFRILSAVLSITMIVGIVAACSSSSEPTNTSSQSTVSEASSTEVSEEAKPVKIRFMWWGGDERHNNTLAAIDLYKKVAPNVTIEGEYSGWDGYQDKLITQLAGGTAPDLMQVDYSWVSDLQRKGSFFADLSKYNELIDLGMFSEDLVNAFCKVDGVTVAVPTGVSAFAFVVNKDLLAKAGVPVDQEWTWDSFLDAAKKVHSLGSNYYFSYDGQKLPLYNKVLRPYVIAHTGNAWINEDYTMGFTRDDLIEAFNYIKTLNDSQAWPPVTEIASASSIVEDPRWINGEIASELEWVSSFLPVAQAIGESADVEVPPVLNGGKDSAIESQPSQLLCVNSKSENIDETVKFLNYFFTDEEALKALKDCRGVPTSEKGLEVAEANNLVDPLILEALDLASKNLTKVPYNAICDDTELTTYGQDTIEKLLFNTITPEAAADELISLYTTRLAEMKTSN